MKIKFTCHLKGTIFEATVSGEIKAGDYCL